MSRQLQSDLQHSSSSEEWGLSLEGSTFGGGELVNALNIVSPVGTDGHNGYLDHEDDKTSTSSGVEDFCPSPVPRTHPGGLHISTRFSVSHESHFLPDMNISPTGIKQSQSYQELQLAIGSELAATIGGLEDSSGRRLPLDYGFVEAKSPPPIGPPALRNSRAELEPFINESESRALIILHPANVELSMLREACDHYGSVSYFREEFQHRGVTFVGYHDLRNAIQAYNHLKHESNLDDRWSIHYSVMLYTIEQQDESRISLRNMPTGTSESDVHKILVRYGELRSIQRTFDGAASNMCEFVIEYFSLEHARLAVSELSASADTHWGAGVTVTYAPLETRKQKLATTLRRLISSWRDQRIHSPYQPFVPQPDHSARYPAANQGMRPPAQLGLHPTTMPFIMSTTPPHLSPTGAGMTYFVLSPRNTTPVSPYKDFPIVDMYQNGSSARGHSGRPNPALPPQRPGRPSYVEEPSDSGRRQDRPSRGRTRTHSNEEMSNTLEIDKVVAGLETRTTVMIRNIPNKYTQQMLLDEINVHHVGTYDFFYLPIDFRNKCNVGYAFINFMDPRSIIPFFQELNGQRWNNFNSEKVCALSYARIQGKVAMITRFQNSSLLEKDNEYRPLLFVSSGEHKGRPEPFPLNGRVKPRKLNDRDRTMSRDSTSSGEREPATMRCDPSLRDRSRTFSNFGAAQSDRETEVGARLSSFSIAPADRDTEDFRRSSSFVGIPPTDRDTDDFRRSSSFYGMPSTERDTEEGRRFSSFHSARNLDDRQSLILGRDTDDLGGN